MSCDVGEVTKIGEWTELYLRHSSLSNPSVASPTSRFILQPFFRFSYVTSSSLNSPGEPPMICALCCYNNRIGRDSPHTVYEKPLEQCRPNGLAHGRARVAHCVTGRWRNVSHYCRPLHLIYVFWAQKHCPVRRQHTVYTNKSLQCKWEVHSSPLNK